MRPAVLHIYAATVATGVAIFAWSTYGWYGWLRVGAGAFPGSPDAVYLYSTSQQRFSWTGGLVAGLGIGALALMTMQRDLARTRAEAVIASLSVVVPLVALLAAVALEPDVQADSAASPSVGTKPAATQYTVKK